MLQLIRFLTVPVPSIFFILLTTSLIYKLHIDVFETWIRFTAWFLPIIVGVMILLVSAPPQHGLGIESAYSGGFILILLGLLNLTYFLVSIGVIILKYRALNRGA